MLLRISTVALNAYREAVRARVLIGLTGVAIAVAFLSLVIGALTLQDAPRVAGNLGVAAVSIFSIVVAIFIGASSLHRELEMKTILPLLARPIRRSEYLVGKYLGTMLVVLVFVMADGGLVLMMSAALGGQQLKLVLGVGGGLAVLLALAMWRLPAARTFGPIPWAAAMFVAGALLCGVAPQEQSLILSSSVLCLLEVAIIAAIATLFSSFSSPFLTALFTVGSIVIGRNADGLAKMPERYFGPAVAEGAKALATVVPNLQIYVPARPLLTGEALDANLGAYIGMAAVQSLGWVLGLLALASFVFQRRDFL